jgi:hypothetical protein
VNHARDEYVNVNGKTTNQAEAYFGQFKRSIDGTHHAVSRRALAPLPRPARLPAVHVPDGRQRPDALADRRRGGRRLTYKPLKDRAQA